MKIVAFSDTHGQHEALTLPEATVAVFAGDCCKYGSRKEFIDFLEWYERQAPEIKVMIAGNHDFCADKHPGFAVDAGLDHNVIYLQDDSAQIDGINFWGTPWTPKFGPFVFMLPDKELNQIFQKIPDNTDVLISHGPPWYMLDKTEEGDNAGSKSLCKRVLDIEPKLHIFGHIHEGYGIRRYGGSSTYANVSVLDRRYNLVNGPTIVYTGDDDEDDAD